MHRDEELCDNTDHGEQAQRMETPRVAERQRFVPQVFQLLLSLMEHLHTLCVLILQLLQLGPGDRRERRKQEECENNSHICNSN